MPNTSGTNATEATRRTPARNELHKCNTSVTQTTGVRHECYTNYTIVAQVKHFDFDNDTSEKIFSHPYISYVANERLLADEKFNS